ncbi:hypothetical protein [Spongiactinospora sp. TRM90649]|uniref:hypothetical protein n=1 Tax=Spongiactinospora sp. TRM90649 TaxID=3031114 RepID=UPI0023F9E16B|nr:hypothetical protein [Spongiactinospora sp. TRM90649]MDF5754911.1 hypothetical protein [Spongiactinospora sp. TRM90649]
MTATLLTGCVLLALGCGAEQGARVTDQPPVSTTPGAQGTPSASGSPSPVVPQGNVVDPREVPWISATPEDGDRLRLVWWSGVEPCNTLDRVDVKETATEVEVTIYEGAAEGKQNVACIEIAVQKTTTVELKTPLEGRKVVDGAK